MLLPCVLGLAFSLVQGAVVGQSAASDEQRLEKRIVNPNPQVESDPETAKTCTQWFNNTVPGVSCEDFSRERSISKREFITLNPSVEAACENLPAPQLYCVKADSRPSEIDRPVLKPKVHCPPGHPKHKPEAPENKAQLLSSHESSISPVNELPPAPEHETRPSLVRETPSKSAKQDPTPSAAQFSPPAVTMDRSRPVVQDGTVTRPVQESPSAPSTKRTLSSSPQEIHSESPTSVNPSKPVKTPEPVQDGITSDCKKFHLVVPGDNCWKLEQEYKLKSGDIIRWNPTVGDACLSMMPDYYICVDGPRR